LAFGILSGATLAIPMGKILWILFFILSKRQSIQYIKQLNFMFNMLLILNL
jgi:hypothetical protein